MQIPDLVLVVGALDGDGCSMLHMGAIKLTHEPQPSEIMQQQQQALQQLQQHILKQHCLDATDLQQLLVQVCSTCLQ